MEIVFTKYVQYIKLKQVQNGTVFPLGTCIFLEFGVAPPCLLHKEICRIGGGMGLFVDHLIFVWSVR